MTCDSGVAFVVIAGLVLALAGWWHEYRSARSYERQVAGLSLTIQRLQQQLAEHQP